MSSAGFKIVSTISNTIQTLLAIALAGLSIWFFIELKGFTDLRDKDKNLLNFEIYWPQVVPWMFLIISIVVICVSVCGIYSACTKNHSILYVYIIFLCLATLAAFAAGTTGLTYTDRNTTDLFVTDTVNDAFDQMKFRHEAKTEFQNIEKRFRCCGKTGSLDYTQSNIPESCCDRSESGDCASSASRRFGCAGVAVKYTRLFIKYTSVGAILMSLICLSSLIVAILLAVVMSKSKTDRFKSEAESEPLKLPL